MSISNKLQLHYKNCTLEKAKSKERVKMERNERTKE